VYGHVQHWFRTHTEHRGLIIYICWGLWTCRNTIIFDDVLPNIYLTCNWILGFFKEHRKRSRKEHIKRRVVVLLIDHTYPVGFFYGAAQGLLGGVGCRLMISLHHSFNLWMGIEACTNNFSEIVALWTCLYWANHLGICDIRIFGDSRVAIDRINCKADIHSIFLQHWCLRIKDLLTHFTGTSFQHIFRENNMEADRMSKRGLGCVTETNVYFEELYGTSVIRTGSHQFF